MSHPDPLQLRRIKIERQINALLNHFVGVLNAKASAFPAGNVAAGSFLLREMPQPMWRCVLFFTALGSYAISVLMAGANLELGTRNSRSRLFSPTMATTFRTLRKHPAAPP